MNASKTAAMNLPLDSKSSASYDRISMRPGISTTKPAESKAEQFQNEVLRPILKMQNDLILNIYKHFLQKRKVKFNGMSIEARAKWIEKSVSNDNRLRGILMGMIIGHFTEEELAIFIEMEGEIRRRMTSLITQRLRDQIKALL